MRSAYAYTILFLAKMGDSVSTWLVLSHGGYETNPLMAYLLTVNPTLFYLAVPALLVLAVYVFRRMYNSVAKVGGIFYPDIFFFGIPILFICLVIANNLMAFHSIR